MLYGILTFLDRRLTIVLPKLFGHIHGIGSHHSSAFFIEQFGVGGSIEIVIIVHHEPSSIKLLCAGHYLKFHSHVVLGLQARAIGGFNIILLHVDFLHIVQVNVFGDIHFYFLYKHRCVVGNHIDATVKTKRLRIEWRETQVDAFHTIYIDSIVEIKLIEIGGNVR